MKEFEWSGMTTMKPLSLPNYAALHQALSKTTLKLHPSQVHGLICGMFSGNPTSTEAWEELVIGKKKSGKKNTSDKTHTLLQALYDMSATQLSEFLFEFKLVLPPDSEVLPSRAEALTLWCQGFLTGLKLTKVALVKREASEITEAINDLIEIAKMNYEEVIESEEDEVAFMELVEYVRMAVILIYQDLREHDASKQAARLCNHLH